MKHVQLAVFALISLISLLVGFVLFDAKTSIQIFVFCAYPATVLLYLLLVISVWRAKVFQWDNIRHCFDRKNWILVVLFVVLAANFVTKEPFGMKTLADEALITSTSQNLHFNREPFYIWRAYNVNSEFTVISHFLDKRPIAFATLLSFLHDLSGYRVENGFALNILLGLGVIVYLGYFGFQIAGKTGAALGMTLMGGLPLLSVYSHGSGFDVFHIFLILLVIHCGLHWYRKSDDWSLIAFVFAGVLLCFSRYEAVMYVVPIAITVLWKWAKDRSIQLPWILMIVPLFMALIPLHQNLFQLNENLWELGNRPEADVIFGPKYFYPNLASAINFLWDGSQVFPNSPWLSSMGLLAFVLLVGGGVLRLRKLVRESPESIIWLSFIATLLAHFILMMVYFYGQFDAGALHRFALPICLFFVLCSIWVLKLFKSPYLRKGLLVIALIGFSSYSLPVMSKHQYTNSNWSSLYSVWVGEYCKKHEGKNYMAIGFNPLHWTVQGVPAIEYSQANKHPERLKYQIDKRGFEKIVIVERIVRDESTIEWGWADEHRLVDGFKTEIISEEFVDPFFFVRVSRLIDVDVDAVHQAVKEAANEFYVKEDHNELLKEIRPPSLENKAGLAEFYFNLP